MKSQSFFENLYRLSNIIDAYLLYFLLSLIVITIIYCFFRLLWQKLVPVKSKSFEDFIEILKKESCTRVSGQVVQDMKGGVFTATVGNIGIYLYYVELFSFATNGRKIVYQELASRRFGSDMGFADVEERGLSALKALATVDAKLQRVKQIFPSIATEILSISGESFDEKTVQKLRSDAQKYGFA